MATPGHMYAYVGVKGIFDLVSSKLELLILKLIYLDVGKRC